MSLEHPTADVPSQSQPTQDGQTQLEEQNIPSTITADSLPLASSFYVTPAAAAFATRASSATQPPSTPPSRVVSRQASRVLPGSMQSMYASGDGDSSAQLQSGRVRELAGTRNSVEESSQIDLLDVEQSGGALVAVEVRESCWQCCWQAAALCMLCRSFGCQCTVGLKDLSSRVGMPGRRRRRGQQQQHAHLRLQI